MDNEIKNIEDFLNTIPKTGGFKVPDNYFENLNDLLFEKVTAKQAKKLTLNWFNAINITAIAASVLLIAGLFLFDPNNMAKQELNEEEIISHLQQEEITVDLLCDAGWCIELDQTEPKNSDLEEEILIGTESDLIITEL
jgi:hypothetical protein